MNVFNFDMWLFLFSQIVQCSHTDANIHTWITCQWAHIDAPSLDAGISQLAFGFIFYYLPYLNALGLSPSMLWTRKIMVSYKVFMSMFFSNNMFSIISQFQL